MRRHGPVIAHCTDSEDFPSIPLTSAYHHVDLHHQAATQYASALWYIRNIGMLLWARLPKYKIRGRVRLSSRVRVAVQFGSLSVTLAIIFISFHCK